MVVGYINLRSWCLRVTVTYKIVFCQMRFTYIVIAAIQNLFLFFLLLLSLLKVVKNTTDNFTLASTRRESIVSLSNEVHAKVQFFHDEVALIIAECDNDMSFPPCIKFKNFDWNLQYTGNFSHVSFSIGSLWRIFCDDVVKANGSLHQRVKSQRLTMLPVLSHAREKAGSVNKRLFLRSVCANFK